MDRRPQAPASPPPPAHDGSIGSLERLAGITDRVAFWMPFASHADGFQDGVDELRRRIAERGIAP